MMITIVVLAFVACSLRSAEAGYCYQCTDGVGNCNAGNSLLWWYSSNWCNGYCGYRCSGGVVTRICSDQFPGINNAASVNTVVAVGGEYYSLCSGDKCNGGSFTCASAASGVVPASQCYDCQDGVQYCNAGNANLNWYLSAPGSCSGYCGFKCTNGVMVRICSTNYPAINDPANIGKAVAYGGDTFYLCSGSGCNSAAYSCPAAATTTPPPPTTTTTALPPVAGFCYRCNPCTGLACDTSSLGSSAAAVACNGYCGYRCTPGSPYTVERVCSSNFNVPSFAIGTAFTSGGSKFLFCSGAYCNTGTLTC